jgi:hypothetical protein
MLCIHTRMPSVASPLLSQHFPPVLLYLVTHIYLFISWIDCVCSQTVATFNILFMFCLSRHEADNTFKFESCSTRQKLPRKLVCGCWVELAMRSLKWNHYMAHCEGVLCTDFSVWYPITGIVQHFSCLL